MDKAEQPKNFFSQWGEFQKNFYSQWMDAYSKLYHPWLDPMKYWQGMKTPFFHKDLPGSHSGKEKPGRRTSSLFASCFDTRIDRGGPLPWSFRHKRASVLHVGLYPGFLHKVRVRLHSHR